MNTPTPRTDALNLAWKAYTDLHTNEEPITFEEHACQLEQELNEAKHDIESYRGALGYSIAGTHDGKLTDGTTPQCGMCNSEYRKSIEAERDQLRKVADELASTIYVHSLRPQNALDGYNQLPHVQERKTK